MSVLLKASRHGTLALQIRHAGWKKWLGVPAKDTPAERRRLDPLCTVVQYELDRGKKLRAICREHLHTDPPGPLPDEAPERGASLIPVSIRDYAEKWLERQVPPLITAATADVRRYITKGTILREWGDRTFDQVTPDALDDWRVRLLSGDRQLAYVRGVITGHFGALLRDAIATARTEARRLNIALPSWAESNPLSELKWKSGPRPTPDPFTPDEKAAILEYFERKHAGWYPFVYWQFEVGTRPSEATGLRVADVDFVRRVASIRRSRVKRRDGLRGKTAASQRDTVIWPWVLDVMPPPQGRAPDAFFLTTPRGAPISQEYFRGVFWGPALKELGIRERRFYCTRHTAISAALSAGERVVWVAQNFGTSIQKIEDTYGKWIGTDGGSALIRSRAVSSN